MKGRKNQNKWQTVSCNLPKEYKAVIWGNYIFIDKNSTLKIK